MPVIINGKTADCGGVVSSGGILQYVSYYVLETVPAYTFSNITFTIDPAEASGNPDMTAAVTGSETLPGSKLASSVEWTDLGTSGTDSTAMSASNTFQAGHYYECRVKFTSSDKTNYQFPGADAGMTITANGTAIQETTKPHEQWAVSCFAYEYDPVSSSYCYTVYLRYGLGTGSTVSGTAVSWNNTDNAVYLLYDSSISDTDIKAEWKDGTYITSAKVLYTGTKGAISAATVDGKSMQEQSFSFNTVEAGTYKLAIFKPGKYVPKIVTITVDGSSKDLEQLKLWLYGDVTYDGKVNSMGDVLNINRYISGLSSIFDKGDEATKKDRFNAANVTAITGTDTVINSMGDVLNINRYIAGLSSILDKTP